MDGKYRNALARCQLLGGALVDRMLAALFPWRCVLCGEGAAGLDLCAVCLDGLPWLPQAESCFRLPVAAAGAPDLRGIAALDYAHPADELVTRLKFRKDRACGRVLGEVLAIAVQELRAAHPSSSLLRPPLPDLLLPVPLHPIRLRRRGYNQAELIARAAGRSLGVSVAADLLRRRHATAAQTRLGRGARLRNLDRAFAVTRALPELRVALVDDVMTTGATLNACVQALHAAGVQDCSVWVAARSRLRRLPMVQLSGSNV